MPLAMYDACVPVCVSQLEALIGVLEKGEAYAGAKKIDPAVLVGARLFPDMFPLSRQVQTASDFAKGTTARLAGLDVPSYEDSEKTFGDLKARLRKTLDFLASVSPERMIGAEDRDIVMKIGGKPVTFKGQPYLFGFALPNLYFHSTMAYAILRHNGVELGKRDFLGKVPGL
jgi:hypothetical protein